MQFDQVSTVSGSCNVICSMSAIGFNGATSACEKGVWWEQRIPLLTKMFKAV